MPRPHRRPRSVALAVAVGGALLLASCGADPGEAGPVPPASPTSPASPASPASPTSSASTGPATEPDAPGAHEVTIRSGDIDLAGTLTVPTGDGPFPAVVLVPGAGSWDRDEKHGPHRPFAVIARALTDSGTAVLRLDDRGIGGSGGDKNAADYDLLGADGAAAVDFLRDHPGIDAERVGVLGHSQGATLAPLIAQRSDVAFLVLLAAPAQSGCDIERAQQGMQLTLAGAPAETAARVDALLARECTELRTGDLAAARATFVELRAILTPDSPPDADEIADVFSPAYTSFLTHRPDDSLRAIRTPVLAVYGGKDLQVPADPNASLMRSLLAQGPDAEVVVLDGTNHALQPGITGMPDEYETIATSVDPALLDTVTGWLASR